MAIFLECKSDNVTCGIKLELLVMTCKALYNATPFCLSSFTPHHFCLPPYYGVALNIFNFLTQVSDFTSKTLNMLVPGIFCLPLPWLIPIHSSVLHLEDSAYVSFPQGSLAYTPRGPKFLSSRLWGTLLLGSGSTSPCIHALKGCPLTLALPLVMQLALANEIKANVTQVET